MLTSDVSSVSSVTSLEVSRSREVGLPGWTRRQCYGNYSVKIVNYSKLLLLTGSNLIRVINYSLYVVINYKLLLLL